jgi:hypothetical protein
VPVYHHNRLVHIHIPKTGGTAIERFFHTIGDMVWGPGSWFGQEQRAGRWYELQHLTWPELGSLSGLSLEEYASFAVVRDPYERMVSDYLWRRSPGADDPDSPLRSFDSFAAFIGAIPPDLDARWAEFIDGADQPDANFLIHVRPQHHYVFDDEASCLVDDLLRFETLDRDLGGLFDRHGLVTHNIRRPPPRDMGQFYDRGLLDHVNAVYAADFDHLGYPRR